VAQAAPLPLVSLILPQRRVGKSPWELPSPGGDDVAGGAPSGAGSSCFPDSGPEEDDYVEEFLWYVRLSSWFSSFGLHPRCLFSDFLASISLYVSHKSVKGVAIAAKGSFMAPFSPQASVLGEWKLA
jgi:hypothetical protein